MQSDEPRAPFPLACLLATVFFSRTENRDLVWEQRNPGRDLRRGGATRTETRREKRRDKNKDEMRTKTGTRSEDETVMCITSENLCNSRCVLRVRICVTYGDVYCECNPNLCTTLLRPLNTCFTAVQSLPPPPCICSPRTSHRDPRNTLHAFYIRPQHYASALTPIQRRPQESPRTKWPSPAVYSLREPNRDAL